MEADQAKQLIRQLAYDWVRVELPTHRLTYTDYINTLAGLNTITDDPDRTTAIFTAVLDQAQRLGYSSEWVQSELKFEAQAEAVGDRAAWLLAVVENSGATDKALDQYNERVNRFSSKP